MVADTSVINESEPAAAQQRVWSMPKSPVNRKQVDEAGRLAANALTGVGAVVARLGRTAAGVVKQTWRAFESVPLALRLLCVSGVLMLLGVVGSIAARGTVGLACAVVVVPICSITVGALGHRWLAGPERRQAAQPATPELGQSVAYIDRKLTLALNALGSERHQQAVIALFQAKTAVELALGTDDDAPRPADAEATVDELHPRPRLRAGNGPRTSLPESNSLAAS